MVDEIVHHANRRDKRARIQPPCSRFLIVMPADAGIHPARLRFLIVMPADAGIHPARAQTATPIGSRFLGNDGK